MEKRLEKTSGRTGALRRNIDCGDVRRRSTGKPAAGAEQPGLPTHRREQDQLAGVGGEMEREARRP